MILPVLVAVVVCLMAYLWLKGGGYKHIPTINFLMVLWKKQLIHVTIAETAIKNRADFVYISFFVVKRLLGTHPDVAKTMLQGDNVLFEKEFLGLVPAFDDLYYDSLLFAGGAKWKAQRSTMTPAFHYDFLQNLVPLFVSKTKRLFAFMDVKGEKQFDVLPFIKRFTVDVIGEAALAQEFDLLSGKTSPYFTAYEAIMSTISLLFLVIPGYSRLPIKNNRVMKTSSVELLRLSREYITARKEMDKHDCLLDLIVHNPEMSELEVINNLFLFFLAGHETTASALGWCLYYLAKHPDVQDKLRAEVLSVLGKDTEPTYENIKQLTYTDMVIKEVLRLKPPAAQILGRISTEPLQIGSLSIPEKTPVSISVYAIHHNPEFWPDPEKFDPERFSPENSKGRHPFAYLPFSLGKRHCIGQNFSVTEQRIFLSMLMQRYEIKYCQEAYVKDDFTLMPPQSVVVKLVERS